MNKKMQASCVVRKTSERSKTCSSETCFETYGASVHNTIRLINMEQSARRLLILKWFIEQC